MDPRISAILTVLIIGILAFLIGLLLTNSKWKTKYTRVKKDNGLLKSQITNLNTRITKLEKDEQNAARYYQDAQEENKHLEDDRDRLKTQNIALNRQLQDLEANHNPQEIDRLTNALAEEKKKRISLEANYNQLKSQSLVGTPKATPNATPNAIKNNKVTNPPQSLTYKLTTIFNRIGLRDPNKEDDLTQINGIGTEITQKLNKIGIYNYKQIALLEKPDLNIIDEALDFFPGRAIRDKWIEQAKWLYDKKYS